MSFNGIKQKKKKKETKDKIEPQHMHCQVDICCFFTRLN